MTVLHHLLAKDFRRTWRNPWPVLLNLALPLVITALFGLAFGGSSSSKGVARIKLAVVDEDDSVLTQFLRGAANQGDAATHLDLRFLKRQEASAQMSENQISAIFIIPIGFTEAYLAGKAIPPLELIKNPAQTIYPALVEEGLRVLTTALNVAARHLGPVLPDLIKLFPKDQPPDFLALARTFQKVGERFENLRPFVDPPRVVYVKTIEKNPGRKREPGFSIFAFLLPGMASAFLLFLADQAVRDLYRERAGFTLQRFATLRTGLFEFVFGKVLFGVATVWLGGLILLGGGGLLFKIQWAEPLALAVLIGSYGFFAAGLLATLAAIAGTERRADAMNTSIVMIIAMAGGGFFPAEQLPAFIRENISVWLPNYWLIESIRGLQNASPVNWPIVSLQLGVLGLVLIAVAAFLFHRQLSKGSAV